jgi:transcriptional regulator with GAF, ATPase, and Fis domain
MEDQLKALREKKLQEEHALLKRALEATEWHLVACAKRLSTPATSLLRAIRRHSDLKIQMQNAIRNRES